MKTNPRYTSTIAKLLNYEISPNTSSDGKRIIRDERMALMARAQAGGDVTALIAEALRVLEMWQGVVK